MQDSKCRGPTSIQDARTRVSHLLLVVFSTPARGGSRSARWCTVQDSGRSRRNSLRATFTRPPGMRGCQEHQVQAWLKNCQAKNGRLLGLPRWQGPRAACTPGPGVCPSAPAPAPSSTSLCSLPRAQVSAAPLCPASSQCSQQRSSVSSHSQAW